MKILVSWGGRTACQNCFKTAAAPYSAQIRKNAGDAKVSKEGEGKNGKEGKEETKTHTHTRKEKLKEGKQERERNQRKEERRREQQT